MNGDRDVTPVRLREYVMRAANPVEFPAVRFDHPAHFREPHLARHGSLRSTDNFGNDDIAIPFRRPPAERASLDVYHTIYRKERQPSFAFNRSCTIVAFNPFPDFITIPTSAPSAACLPAL